MNINHYYYKNGKKYKMNLKKYKQPTVSTFSINGNLVTPQNGQSAVAPTKVTFYILENNQEIDVTRRIESKLKDEIISGFWKNNKNMDRFE